MAITYGLTDAGFVPKPLEDIKSEIEGDIQTTIGTSIDTAPQSNWEQLLGPISDRLASLWSLGEAIYAALTPDGAAAAAQDALCSLTGTGRKAPTYSHVVGICCGTATTVLPAGRVTSVTGTSSRFASAEAATLAAVAAYQTTHLYAVGDRVTSNGKVWQCLLGGTTGGPGAEPPAADVGTLYQEGGGDGVTWRCVGEGDGAADVEFAAQAAGPLVANAGTLTRIETPVSGWSTVYNVVDAYVLGAALETDAALRLRREIELRAQGGGAVAAIRAKGLDVEGVQSCVVFENTTDSTDADGLLPHSVEVVVESTVLDEVDDAIRAAIFAVVGGGIATNGAVVGNVTDAQGVAWEIHFTRTELVPVYVKVEASVDPDNYPVDGDDRINSAVLAYGALTYKNGSDVISAALNAQPFKISGVVDSVTKISTSPTPSSTATIPISLRQIPVLDSARITVVATPRTTS